SELLNNRGMDEFADGIHESFEIFKKNPGEVSFAACRFGDKDKGPGDSEEENVNFQGTGFHNQGKVSFHSALFLNGGAVNFERTQFDNDGLVSFSSAQFSNNGGVYFCYTNPVERPGMG
ncbi:MAG: hypothetical protein ACE5G9_14125, partial [Nitrospinales bacterium]